MAKVCTNEKCNHQMGNLANFCNACGSKLIEIEPEVKTEEKQEFIENVCNSGKNHGIQYFRTGKPNCSACGEQIVL